MTVEGLSHGRHPQLVGHDLADDVDLPLDGVDLLGRRRPHHPRAPDRDRRASQLALGHLGVTVGVGDDELHALRAGHAPEARLTVERAPVVESPRALRVGEEGLADVPDSDLLAVLERGDRRVETLALAHPRAEQEAKRRHIGVERGAFHAPDPNWWPTPSWRE